MARLEPTPGQTVGPFFHYGLEYPASNELVEPDAEGALLLRGSVTDGEGQAVPDALIEIWQPRPDGSHVPHGGHFSRDAGFGGFGRCATDDDGRYWFRTLVPGSSGGGPAFIAVTVFARGLLDRLFTRLYLPGTALDADALLESLPTAAASRLVAVRDGEAVVFNIVLQGDQETPFLSFDGRE